MNDLLINSGLKIANSYVIQAEEDNLKLNLNREIYFDAADVIKLIQGVWAVYNYKFDKREFSDPSSLVLAFAFNGYLGQIKLLPPHQDELISNIKQRKHSFPDFYPFKVNEAALGIFYALGLEEFTETHDDLDFTKYTKKLKRNSRNLFILDQLLSEFEWTKRFKSLTEGSLPRILLNDVKYSFEEIIQKPLFKKIHAAFDEIRPHKIKNNIIDSIALYELQEKLISFKKAPDKNPLPIFYVSKKSTFKVVEKIMLENEGVFLYESNNIHFPIIRSADFFILDAIFSPKNKIENLEEFLKAVNEIKRTLKLENDTIEIIKETFGKKEYKKFSHIINEVIDIEFFSKIWLENENYKNLNELIKDYINYNEDTNSSLSDYVVAERKLILSKLDKSFSTKSYDKFIFFKIAIDKLFEIRGIIKDKGLTAKRSSDVFNEFALFRFAFNENTTNRIQSSIENIIDCCVENEDLEFNHIITELAGLLVSSVYDEQNENTIYALGLLWSFEHYKLISEVCDRFNGNYENYQSALIHAASIFPSGEKKVSKVLEICNCTAMKFEERNYKAWIGLSHIYFQLWYELEHFPILLELMSESNREKLIKSNNNHLIENAMIYADQASIWLKQVINTDENKTFARTRRYYYAINNYLYFITKISPSDKFQSNEILSLVDILESASINPSYIQSRFFDTLAYYYLRRALLSSTKEAFDYYINNAQDRSKLSIKSAKVYSELLDYNRLDKKIMEIKFTGFEKYNNKN